MADVLADILETRRARVASAKAEVALSELESVVKGAAPARGFAAALARGASIAVIAEMKRKSPSAGPLREPYDVPNIAKAYEAGGVHALSVLTEPDRFGGSLGDLMSARNASKLPILEKDFVFDSYQIAEARAGGADAVLLIADMLDASLLRELAAAARTYGVDALVEVFTESSVEAALSTGAKLIGINTRNLRTLEMVPDNVIRLSARVPADRLIVAESGLKTPQDIKRLKSSRVKAILVGESLLKQSNLSEAAKILVEAGQ